MLNADANVVVLWIPYQVLIGDQLTKNINIGLFLCFAFLKQLIATYYKQYSVG